MLEFIIVGLGGFLGTCLRFALTKLTAKLPIEIPCGTLISNVAAGLFIGFILGLEQQSTAISPKVRLFLTTGFMGGLSTFSTFSAETVKLFQEGKPWLAAGNMLLNLALSLAAVVLGMWCAKALRGKSFV
ncbi:MAG: fluoride efflux transporter CrcB [Oscillospiraceae bacterium]|jgi:CrcB protein|nr:fluoride efflux transporter CrcB [Oscillospiraceae bacterium]